MHEKSHGDEHAHSKNGEVHGHSAHGEQHAHEHGIIIQIPRRFQSPGQRAIGRSGASNAWWTEKRIVRRY